MLSNQDLDALLYGTGVCRAPSSFEFTVSVSDYAAYLVLGVILLPPVALGFLVFSLYAFL